MNEFDCAVCKHLTMRIGSLFSGAGGLDMAVRAVFGADIVWHAEIDKAASKLLAYRFPGVPNLGSVTDIDWAAVPPVDVLCGGFPCQDVSAAGKRAGIKAGTRSGLWSVFADAIDALRPQWVVIENVRGLLSATAQRTVDDGRDPLEPEAGVVGNGAGGPVLRAIGAVLGDLSDLGYDSQWATVAAAAVGAPHRRERVFILASAADASVGQYADNQFAGRDGAALAVAGRNSDRPTPDAKRGSGTWFAHTAGDSEAHSEGRQAVLAGRRGDPDVIAGDEPGLIECVWCRRMIQPGTEISHPCVGEKAAMLPTPRATDGTDGPVTNCPSVQAICDGSAGRAPRLSEMAAGGLFGDEPGVALLPTPRNTDGERGPSAESGGMRPSGQPRQKDLNTVTVREFNALVERGPEPEHVVVGEDDGAVPVFPGDGGGDHPVLIALNGDGVAVGVGSGENSHSSCVPGELAGTKSDLNLLPTPEAKNSHAGPDYARMNREGSGGHDLVTALTLLCTPSASDGAGGKTSRSGDRIDEPLLGGQAREMSTAWGKYEPAIRRWEQFVGPAPAPTEPNKNGNPRLSAAFSEWMMGWPAGWVTDPAIGISRNDQLRIVGNGVCPQQAEVALRILLQVAVAA